MKKKAPKPKQTATEKLEAVGIEAICAQIADGVYYRVIADQVGVSRGTLLEWLEKHEVAYARSLEVRAHILAEDILMISDDATGDLVEKDGKIFVDRENILRSRLKVDTRKWLASKMFPRRYGEKLDVGVGPLPILPDQASMLEAARRIAFVLKRGSEAVQNEVKQLPAPPVVKKAEATKPEVRVTDSRAADAIHFGELIAGSRTPTDAELAEQHENEWIDAQSRKHADEAQQQTFVPRTISRRNR